MSIDSNAAFRSIRCPQCSTALAVESWEIAGALVVCPGCNSQLMAQIYPAMGHARPESRAGQHAMDGEAVCFFHSEKRAALSCERCGRFICELCDMPLGGRHLCPACLGSGLQGDKLPELVNRRWCWSRLALISGGVPLLIPIYPFFLITAPLAIGLAIYGWSKPGSIVHGRRRWFAVLAIVFALVQLAALAGLGMMFWKVRPHV